MAPFNSNNMITYLTLEARIEDIDQLVNQKLKDGWKLFGNPFYVLQGDTSFVQYVKAYQAMIKEQ